MLPPKVYDYIAVKLFGVTDLKELSGKLSDLPKDASQLVLVGLECIAHFK